METSAVVMSRADTLLRVDTLRSRLALTVTPRGAALDISITAFDVHDGSGAMRATLREGARVLARFNEHGGVGFEGAGLADCGSPAAAAANATRDLWLRAPSRVVVGDVWTDSIATSLCRDGIQLSTTIRRSYRVVAASSSDSLTTLTIERESAIALSGSGELRGDSVEIHATGTGRATLRLSTATGWVESANGESTLNLDARTPGRVQSVVQVLEFSARTQPPR